MEITEEVIDIQIKAFEKKIDDFRGYLSMIECSDEAQYLVEKIREYETAIYVLKFQKGLLNDEKDAVEELNNMKIYITKKE